MKISKIDLSTVGNVAILVMLVVLLFRTCKKQEPVVIENNKVIQNDTTRIHHVVTDTTYKHVTRHFTKRYFYSDTSYLDPVTQDSVNKYVISHQDSTIKINHNVETFGSLKNFSFDYKLKIPNITTRITDTLRIVNRFTESKTIVNTEYVYRHGIYGGVEFGYEVGDVDPLRITTSVLYQNRNGVMWGVGYEAMKSTPEIKVYVPIITFKPKR